MSSNNSRFPSQNRISESFKDYFGRCDLGPSPFRQLFRIAWAITTVQGSLWLILTFTLSVYAINSVLLQFHLMESLMSLGVPYLFVFVVWLCSQGSLLMCLYIYCRLLLLNYWTVEFVYMIGPSASKPSLPHVCLILLEGLCIVVVYFEMMYWYTDLLDKAGGGMYPFIMQLFVGSRLLHHILAGIFMITVCPLQKKWTMYTNKRTKEYVVQLIPWTYYYLLHNGLLILLLRHLNTDYSSFHMQRVFSLFYPLVYGYAFFKMFWLTFLAIQITNSSLVPVLYPPEADMPRLEGAYFEVMTNWTRDSKSEVVSGKEWPFSTDELPDKSLIICGTIEDRFLDVMKPLQENEVLRKKQLEQPELLDTSLIDPKPGADWSRTDPDSTRHDLPALLSLDTLMTDNNNSNTCTIVEGDGEDTTTTVRRRGVGEAKGNY